MSWFSTTMVSVDKDLFYATVVEVSVRNKASNLDEVASSEKVLARLLFGAPAGTKLRLEKARYRPFNRSYGAKEVLVGKEVPCPGLDKVKELLQQYALELDEFKRQRNK